MPALWGDIEWGDSGWGEADSITIGPFTDLGGNELSLPASAQAIFGEQISEGESTRIYDFHIKSVRDIDAAGTLLWKRFCNGPEHVWADIEETIESLTTLYNVDTIDDRFLQFLKLTALWADDTNAITDKLSPSELRQLIAQSPELWDRRGIAGSYTEILNTIIGVDAFEVDWFDRRWVLGDTPLGSDGFDFGAMVLDSSEQRIVDVHLMDTERGVDRELVGEILKLWRPSGERVQVVFAELFDLFADDTNPKSWVVSVGGGASTPATIASGAIAMASDSFVYSLADRMETKRDYLIRAVITPDSLADYFGVAVRHLDSAMGDQIEIRVDPAALTLTIYQNGVQLAGTVTVDLSALGFSFVAGFPRELRVQVMRHEALDYFAVWLDNEPVYQFTTSSANATGTAGAIVGAGETASLSFFEMLPLPGETLTVGLGGAITVTP